MVDYLYDGSFQGFLTCVYLHYYEEKAAGIYPAAEYQVSLLRQSRQVETDSEKADRVYAAIEKKISGFSLNQVYKVFLSSVPEKENIALQYLRLGFKMGGGVAALHSHPLVFAVQEAAHKVGREVERFSGILRFSVLAFPGTGGEATAPFVAAKGPAGAVLCETAGESRKEQEILYSKIEPDHDILELLGNHFADRFKGDPFIIHDARRKKALFAIGGQWYIAPLDEKQLPGLAQSEVDYRRLWKSYFHAIAIKERTNPRCQRQFMPARYWKNLTEMHGRPGV